MEHQDHPVSWIVCFYSLKKKKVFVAHKKYEYAIMTSLKKKNHN